MPTLLESYLSGKQARRDVSQQDAREALGGEALSRGGAPKGLHPLAAFHYQQMAQKQKQQQKKQEFDRDLKMVNGLTQRGQIKGLSAKDKAETFNTMRHFLNKYIKDPKAKLGELKENSFLDTKKNSLIDSFYKDFSNLSQSFAEGKLTLEEYGGMSENLIFQKKTEFSKLEDGDIPKELFSNAQNIIKQEKQQQRSEISRGLAGLYSGEDLPRGPLPSKAGLAGQYLRAGGTPSGLKTLKETFTPVESKDFLKQERLAFERKRLSSAEKRAEATAKIQRRQIEIAEKKLNLEYEKLTKQKPKGKKLSFSDIAKIIDSVERLAEDTEGNISNKEAWSKFPSAREFAISKEDKNRLLRAFQINFGDPPVGFNLPITSGPTIPPGVNKTDIEYTAEKYGISKEEVIKRLSNAP